MLNADQHKALDAARSQLRRGVLELCILSIIASEAEIYPPTIKDRLEASQLDIKEGTLYPLLTRLKNSALLDYTWRESTAGPPRKYFTITEQGLAFLEELRQTWQGLVDIVQQTTTTHTSTTNQHE